ncbi:MAG: 3-deoxy-8-phosphooctulonate synthase [Proteobacteria bacterium]|nr:3-deoxy-8-phosphooctulonate synthase [Pseudomonadota bacterium]
MKPLTREVRIEGISVGGANGFLLVAGPCVIENKDTTLRIAQRLKTISETLEIPLIFKTSYDKANRTSVGSFRGPGLREGLNVLRLVKEKTGLPVLSDIHTIDEVKAASQVLDVVQIPAFLCRQTDLVLEIARTMKPVNVKKGQFLAPWDIKYVIEKVVSTGNHDLMVTERGACFGYNNLVTDFRALSIMRGYGYPVIFDATHSVQLPGGMGQASGGQVEFVAPLSRAAIAVGVDGIFLEVHENPSEALCDGQNTLSLDDLPSLLKQLKTVESALGKDDNGD